MRCSRSVVVCVCVVAAVVNLTVVLKVSQIHTPMISKICATLTGNRNDSGQHRSAAGKDSIDSSPALAVLVEYSQRYDPRNQSKLAPADPNRPETIRTWWQALAMVDWYMQAPVRHTCQHLVKAGNWYLCQDQPYTVRPPCLVYSFGINWDFSFDDAMAKIGCEVHSFDPSMKTNEHKRGNMSTFHNLGIGSYNTDWYLPRQDMYVKDTQIWKVRTVKSIMEELGHKNRVIDVFKMDVETYEWTIIDNMIETDVFRFIRQFELEFHLFKYFPSSVDYVHIYQVYTRLRESGFREYVCKQHQRKVTQVGVNKLQADLAYVNAFFEANNLG